MSFSITGQMKVSTLKDRFNSEFGLTLRVYDGRSFADPDKTVSAVRKKQVSGELSVKKSMLVGNLEDKIMKLFGIKVQIAGSDDSYLCDNALSLANALEKDQKKMEKNSNKNNSENDAGSKEENPPVADEKERSDDDGIPKWVVGVAKTLESDINLTSSGELAMIAFGRVRSDWSHSMNNGEISFYSTEDDYIFVDTEGEESWGTEEMQIFKSDEGKIYISIASIDRGYFVMDQELNEDLIENFDESLPEFIYRMFSQFDISDEDVLIDLAMIVSDVESEINELESSGDGQGRDDGWYFQVGEGDMLKFINEDIARNSFFVDVVYASDVDVEIDDGSFGLSEGEGKGEFEDVRNDGGRFLGLRKIS